MNVLCLCPTYNRPQLAANALACFMAQDYPAEKRRLLVLDDAGQIDSCAGPSWRMVSTSERFPSLPAKFNAMLNWASFSSDFSFDAVAIWEDDDIFYCNHLSAAVAALESNPLANAVKSSRVWSLYNSATPFQEDATGRFHSSMVIRAAHLRTIGGWPDTKRADFDQQLIARCQPFAEPQGMPSYVFRWGSTGAPHGQGQMRSPDDETWWDRCEVPADQIKHHGELVPRMDDETRRVYGELAAG